MSSFYGDALTKKDEPLNEDIIEAGAYNDKVLGDIQRICWPLFNLKGFNIEIFEYGKIFNNGTLVYLSTHPEWHQIHLMNFANSRFMLEHIKLIFQDKRACHIWDINHIDLIDRDLNNFIERRRSLGIWHDFTMYTHQEDCIEFSSFATNRKSNFNVNLYMNNAGVLKGFSEFFKEQATEILCELYSRKICIAPEDYFSSSIVDEQLVEMAQKKQEFLKKVRPKRYLLETPKGIIKLTIRELQCLGYRCSGMIAKEIARKIINRKTKKPISVGSVYLYFAKIACKAYGQTFSQLRHLYVKSNLANLPLEEL